jgi:hypothetical protein
MLGFLRFTPGKQQEIRCAMGGSDTTRGTNRPPLRPNRRGFFDY